MSTLTRVTAERYHDFSCGHRVVGHEGKCAQLHGHNYRVTFIVEAEASSTVLDEVGRVIDFGVIKDRLCGWVEAEWDHKFLAWHHDLVVVKIEHALYAEPIQPLGKLLDGDESPQKRDAVKARSSIVWVPFNPTAENMALYLLNVVGPDVLRGTAVRLRSVRVEETRKCSASAMTVGDEA